MLMNILMASVMCLPLSKQEEDVLDHTNVKCHFVYFSQLWAQSGAHI